MLKREPDQGATERSAEPGHGPQTLAQLQATGAEVVGSDGDKIGDLKEVGDADFLVGRTLRRNLRLPVSRVREVTSENKIVLDLTTAEAKELGEKESLGEAAPGARSMAENPGKEEKGAWGSGKESKLVSTSQPNFQANGKIRLGVASQPPVRRRGQLVARQG